MMPKPTMIQATTPPASMVSMAVVSVRSVMGLSKDSSKKASRAPGRFPAARALASDSPPPAARSINRPSPSGSSAPEPWVDTP